MRIMLFQDVVNLGDTLDVKYFGVDPRTRKVLNHEINNVYTPNTWLVVQ